MLPLFSVSFLSLSLVMVTSVGRFSTLSVLLTLLTLLRLSMLSTIFALLAFLDQLAHAAATLGAALAADLLVERVTAFGGHLLAAHAARLAHRQRARGRLALLLSLRHGLHPRTTL